ncbi:MAG: TlpA disulfide reductase family protein [Nitrospiraceae bacterium]|nr:TlpA disulfide reductase family protein [Nitrospiraceae bacterium]
MSAVARRPGFKFRFFPPLLIVFCLASFGFAGIFSARTAEAAAAKAPDFSLKTVNGKAYALSAYRGKPVLLNFWATWCPACREELPSLVKLARKYKGKLQVLSVSIDSPAGPLKEYLGNHPLPFPVLSDPNREVAFDLYAVFGLPATFLIDKNGNLIERVYGAQDWMSPGMVGKVKKLLSAK